MVGLSKKRVFPKTKGDSITGQDRAQKHCDFKDLSYEERLRELNLPTLEYRRRRGDLIQMFKILHGIDSSKFVTLNENTTRGHSLKLNKPRCLKSWHCLRVRYRTPRIRGYGSGTGLRATPVRTVSRSGSL